MPTHSEKKKLPYTSEQLFQLVADVEQYPKFLPWVIACHITDKKENVFYADLIIGFKMFREAFTSRVVTEQPNHIHVEYISGPMKYLSNHWKFEDNSDGTCIVDFYLDFEFKSPLLQKVVGVLFHEAVRRMVSAFEQRARVLYK
jgi:coenzyme Q-binding protein COQ10